MNSKLYVGNIPFTATQEELSQHFAQAGRVAKVDVIMDRETGRPRGFAFVEMMADDEAAAAVQQLNGKNFGGRELVVNIARPKEPRGNGGGNNFSQDRRRHDNHGGRDRDRDRRRERY